MRLASLLRRFASAEGGTVSIMMLPLTLSFAALGGLAIDHSNVVRERTLLQAAADAAAHAAIVTRVSGEGATEAEAVAAAMGVARAFWTSEGQAGAITQADVEFGTWDGGTRVFTPQPGATQAVRVTALRAAARGNELPTYLLHLARLAAFTTGASAIYESYVPACMTNGFYALERVDMQSDNAFEKGFCAHSQSHVELNNNNVLEPGVQVSMPDKADLVIPSSGFENNPGLEEALRSRSYPSSILDRLDDIVLTMPLYGSSYMPDYVSRTTPVEVGGQSLGPSDLTAHAINELTGPLPGKKNKKADGPCRSTVRLEDGLYENMVIVTDCPVTFKQGAELRNVVVVTSSTDASSFSAASGLVVGRDDGCAPGGGAKLITRGGMRFPSGLNVFGAQLIAGGDIQFAAQADGVEGAAFVAGGEIDGTSNALMAGCQVDDVLATLRFRLVQ